LLNYLSGCFIKKNENKKQDLNMEEYKQFCKKLGGI